MSTVPVVGAAVIYTSGKRLAAGCYAGQLDAVHMGLVLRTAPRTFAIEGNTTLGKYDRNGYVLTLKEVEQGRVLCFVLPEAAR